MHRILGIPDFHPEIHVISRWERAVQRSMEKWMNHLTTSQVLGMTPCKTPEENLEIMRHLWSDKQQAQQARLHLENTISRLAMEFYEQNVEYGYTYDSSAIILDGTFAPELTDDVHVYEPSTRPGSTLPHAWLYRLGQRKALGDLAGHGRFLLITGKGGEDWIQAAARIAQEQGLPLVVININPFSDDWLDTRPTKHPAHRPAGSPTD
jgi:2,4-dichlorophenol 6-monooxygenase